MKPIPGLDALLARTRSDWKSRVERVAIDLPPAVADWTASLRSNLAYILINAVAIEASR